VLLVHFCAGAKGVYTYSFSSARLAYMSTVLSSHCDVTYSWKICVVSGLYLSRPLRIASICSGLSGASSKATPMVEMLVGYISSF